MPFKINNTWLDKYEEDYYDDGEPTYYPTSKEEEIELTPAEECYHIQGYGSYIICGKSGSGKSELMKNIAKHNSLNGLWHKIYVLCPTGHLQKTYDYIPSKYIISNPTENHLKLILKEQELNPKQRSCIILDDMVGSANFRHSKLFDLLASSCRHYRLTMFYLVQNLKAVSTTLRQNCNEIFITRVQEHSMKAIYDMSSGFSSFTDFKSFMEQVCKNYRVVKFYVSGIDDKTYDIFLPTLAGKTKLQYN